MTPNVNIILTPATTMDQTCMKQIFSSCHCASKYSDMTGIKSYFVKMIGQGEVLSCSEVGMLACHR